MNWLQSLLYGIISGLAEFVPISSYGHQVFLRRVFGQEQRDPLMDLLVHIGLLLAVMVSCRSALAGYIQEFSGTKRRRRINVRNQRRTYDLRFLIAASLVMLAVLLFNRSTVALEGNFLWLCGFFVINGIVFYVLDHMRHANKDSSQMSGMDAILTGFMGGMSIFPGISRVGMCLASAVGRGAEKSVAYNWALILSVPALMLLILFDLIGLFVTAGFAITFIGFLHSVLAAIGAFVFGYLIIMFMRLMIVNSGFAGYACYCWGAAMLTFVLYLVA